MNSLRIGMIRSDVQECFGVWRPHLITPVDLVLDGNLGAGAKAKRESQDGVARSAKHSQSYLAAVVAIWVSTASASASVNSCVLFEWFIEQNLGPHMEQNAASLKPSSGSVSS